MLNCEFMVISVILMAAILKIGHVGYFVPTDQSRVNRLILTQEMSLNKMIRRMEGLGEGGGAI